MLAPSHFATSREEELDTTVDPLVSIRHNLRANMSYLRRFGRAITGNQTWADISVVQLMEDLLANPELTRGESTPRVALYKRLLELITSLQDENGPIPTPPSRQAHLLTAVEGFDNAQAAEILSASAGALKEMIEEVHRDLTRQAGARALVIEDEPLIAAHLKLQLRQLGHEVVGTAVTLTQAIEKGLKARPDLILSDVQLADGSSGIDAVDKIQCAFDVPVIFITAYPERLLTGKRPEPIFLIAKPYMEEAVRATISHALFLDSYFRTELSPGPISA